MYFDHQILYGKGALALVWRAGNGEFVTAKGRRNKDYRALTGTNIRKLCDRLRQLLPEMGTANGLSLIKMGTLIQGIGVIHSIKMDTFARDIHRASIILKRPPQGEMMIDAPLLKSKQVLKKPNKAVQAAADLAQGIHPDFQQMDVDDPAGFVFQTPRALPSGTGEISDFEGQGVRTTLTREVGEINEDMPGDHETRRARKRRRDDDDEETVRNDVLSKLRVGVDPRAHCLPEHDDNLLARQDEQPELDFGDGQDMLNAGTEQLDLGWQGAAPVDQPFDDEQPGPAPRPTTTTEFSGLPSVLSEMQTPAGAGTQAENTRRRRNEGREQMDATSFELAQLDENPQGLRGQPGIRGRRRLRFKVDRVTYATLRELQEQQVQANMEDLLREADARRAPPKSTWRMVEGWSYPTPNPLKFITLAGRKVGSDALRIMVQQSMANQTSHMAGRAVELHRPEPSVTGMSIAVGSPSRTFGTTRNQGLDELPRLEEEPWEEPPIPVFQDINEERMEDNIPVIEMEPAAGPAPRKKTRSSMVAEESRLTRSLNGSDTKTFGECYPPGQVSKRRAAMAFFVLLKMQAEKKVSLHQDEPYGTIIIETLNAGSSDSDLHGSTNLP